MFNVNEKVPNRSTAKAALERCDDDPQGVFIISNEQKVPTELQRDNVGAQRRRPEGRVFITINEKHVKSGGVSFF